MRRLKRDLIHKGRVTNFVVNTYEAPDGSQFQRELLEHPGAAVIVPMISPDEVLMVEQFRPGANRPLLEFPAGCLDAGEDPLACAARELAEETGYRAGKLESLFTMFPSPAFMSEQMYLFLATDLTPAGGQQLDEHEYVTVRQFSLRDLRIQMRSGNIKDGKTIAALCYLLAFKPWLAQEQSKQQ